jgi:signal peptide peptidase SppA
MKRQLLLAQFSAIPWALAPEHLEAFSAVLHRWAAGVSATPEVMADVNAAQAARAARQKTAASVGGGIAVLPLYGVITQRASMVDDISGGGGTSTQRFTQAFRDAMADDTVSGIIIDLDSPGGSVFGTGELAAEILAARGTKPVIGFVNSLCASAAYWIGSACDSLYMTQGGQVGSIGVYMQHVDISAAMEMDGVKSSFISAGKYKTEGNSMGPLDPDARGFMQSQVDAYYSAFTSAIAKGRGVPAATVRDSMGQGRCLMASDAVSQGMVDGVDTFDGVVSRMTKVIKAGGAKASLAATGTLRAEDIVSCGFTGTKIEAGTITASRIIEGSFIVAEAAPADQQVVVTTESAGVDQPVHHRTAAARRRALEIASL